MASRRIGNISYWGNFVIVVCRSSVVDQNVVGHCSHVELNEEWLLIRKNGRVVEAYLRQGALVHPMLIVLPFRYGLYFTAVILTPDKVNADTLRRLRVRLRFKRNSTPN